MDLISKLADDLIALNNASPRLPRKEQIEEVLRAGMADKMFIVDGQSGGGFIWTDTPLGQETVTFGGCSVADTSPMLMHAMAMEQYKECAELLTGSYLATQEQLVKAADDICAHDPVWAYRCSKCGGMVAYSALHITKDGSNACQDCYERSKP